MSDYEAYRQEALKRCALGSHQIHIVTPPAIHVKWPSWLARLGGVKGVKDGVIQKASTIYCGHCHKTWTQEEVETWKTV